jgi:hypothetical protein
MGDDEWLLGGTDDGWVTTCELAENRPLLLFNGLCWTVTFVDLLKTLMKTKKQQTKFYGWIWTLDVWVDVGIMIIGGEGEAWCDVNKDDRRELTLLFGLLFVALAERIGWD